VIVPKISLTDLVIQNIKPPARGQVDYWDANVAGFGVRVSKGGTKSFVVLQHRERKSIGRYPAMSLKQARAEAKRRLYGGGVEPEKSQVEISYQEAVDRYLIAKMTEIRSSTLENYTHLLSHVKFTVAVGDVRPYQIEDALARIKSQSGRSHTFTVLKSFFNWCVAREYCRANPLHNLKKPKMPSPRERVLEDDELAEIWRVCDQLEKYGAMVRLLMLTGQRKNQIARLQTTWIKNGAVTFPAEVMKNNREHWCPLGGGAEYVLLGVMPVDKYYFSPVTAVGRPFSNWSKSKSKLDSLAQLDPWTLHDLRRTWATNAPRLDIPQHITSRTLSHVSEEHPMVRVYNRHTYRGEMSEAMKKMNDHILSLIVDEPTSKRSTWTYVHG